MFLDKYQNVPIFLLQFFKLIFQQFFVQNKRIIILYHILFIISSFFINPEGQIEN